MTSRQSQRSGLQSEGDTEDQLVSSLNNQKASPRESKEPLPSSASSPPPPLQFITLTERPASHKNDYSYTVRSHAMQAFLHEKKNAKGDNVKQKRGPSKDLDQQTPKQLSGKFKLASWTRKPRTKKVKAPVARGDTVEVILVKDEDVQNEIQPSTPVQTYGMKHFSRSHLNGLPISMTNTQTWELLYHSFISNAFAIGYDNAWKPFSITDQALLHATLCLAAQHQDLLRGTNDSSESLFHKGEAMRLMNRRLLEKWHSISDADVTSVALFVILESINGTFEAANAHRVGLLKMTRLRGGIWSFETNGVVLRVLAWSDIVFSTRFGFPTKFPCLSEGISSFFQPSLVLEDHYTLVFHDSATTSFLQTLRYMSSTIDLPDLSFETKKNISDSLYRTEYEILASPYMSQFQSLENFQTNEIFDSPPPMELDTHNQTTHEMLTAAFQITALLYLHLMIRELPNPSLLHRRLLSHLISIVNEISIQLSLSSLLPPNPPIDLDQALHSSQSIDTPRFSQEELDILLWIVFIGVAASSERESRITFVMAMRGAEPDVLWSEMEDVGVRLRRVAWRESRCERVLESIWSEMKDSDNWY